MYYSIKVQCSVFISVCILFSKNQEKCLIQWYLLGDLREIDFLCLSSRLFAYL